MGFVNSGEFKKDNGRNLSINREELLKELLEIVEINEHSLLRIRIDELKGRIGAGLDDKFFSGPEKHDESPKVNVKSIMEEMDQILDAFTIERSKYYLDRLIEGLTKTKETGINDINLNRWKDYKDIETNTLWVFEKRDRAGAHNADYWGNFIPQIPYQLLSRYTKKGEWVLDTFVGSGTTLIECRRLGRNGIGIDISPEAVALSSKNLALEENPLNARAELITGDSTKIDYRKELDRLGVKTVQFIMMHPPYWDIIKFGEDPSNLANSATLKGFLKGLRSCAERTYEILDDGRYLALVIGDKYSKGELIPLGFHAMNEILGVGYRLKSIIVKNFEETKGKHNQKELWRYRALAGGFYVFKHEYIFLFEKQH